MRTELLALASDLARREESFVLAIVVRRQPASSAQTGDMALITAAGEFHGWLGGSCTRPSVLREAQRALADGTPRLLVLSPDTEADRRPGVTVLPMTCASGGSVEIYVEPVLPAARLVVFGVSPVARALVRIGKAVGYSVVAADGADEPDLFPDADHVGPAAPLSGTAPPFAVVATMGEHDEESIIAALALHPAYLGVIASTRRYAQIRDTLIAQGVAPAALEGIRSPAGVSIGARRAEEIALSVLAEIVQRRAHAEPVVDAPPAAVPSYAIDPICKMAVEIATARHTADYEGHTYYFCCGGCRTRFLAQPECYT
jgi:xanthine dehydrogenase accessory factor